MQIESVNDHVKWEVLRSSCFGQADLHDPKKYDIFCTAINISRHLQCMEVPTLTVLPMRGNISPSSVRLGLWAEQVCSWSFESKKGIYCHGEVNDMDKVPGKIITMAWMASPWISNSEGRVAAEDPAPQDDDCKIQPSNIILFYVSIVYRQVRCEMSF